MSLDEAEAVFVRRVPAALRSLETLRQYAGRYETPTGAKFEVVLKQDGTLGIAVRPASRSARWCRGSRSRFRVKEFSDVVIEFVVEDGKVKAMKQTDPSGEFRFPRQ